MAFVIRFAKTIRNHWKKSTFFGICAFYGASYTKDKYEINKLMHKYCSEASRYGDESILAPQQPKRIIVILNQAANKKKAKETFEKYCEPILHLGGFLVEIIQTDSANHARRYVEELPVLPDCILAAGGDGTLSEVITGICRRPINERCPMGILPCGRTNSVGKQFFADALALNNVQEVESLAKSAISVLRGHKEKKDAMKIEEIFIQDPPDKVRKPIYSVGGFRWGAFQDILNKRDKYWYTNGLREYTAFLFNAFSSNVIWNCKANLLYTDPCSGCSNCRTKPIDVTPQNTRWWSKFVPRTKTIPSGPDYSKIINTNCEIEHQIEIGPTDMEIITRNLMTEHSDLPKLSIKLGPENSKSISFLLNSWSRLWNKGPMHAEKIIDIRSVEIVPDEGSTEEKAIFFSIDNDNYEVKPIKITVVPEAIEMYVLKKS